MSDVFYLRPIDPPATPEALQQMAQHAGGCFKLHRVDWKQSFLSDDGQRMLCWYRAPDAESARLALKELGSNMNAVWAGTVIGERESPRHGASERTVVAESVFESPRSGQELAAALSRLEDERTTLVRSFFSSRGTRLVCVCSTSSTDAVKASQRALEGVGLSAEAVWSCLALTPDLPA
jgi:hypothetical protein